MDGCGEAQLPQAGPARHRGSNNRFLTESASRRSEHRHEHAAVAPHVDALIGAVGVFCHPIIRSLVRAAAGSAAARSVGGAPARGSAERQKSCKFCMRWETGWTLRQRELGRGEDARAERRPHELLGLRVVRWKCSPALNC